MTPARPACDFSARAACNALANNASSRTVQLTLSIAALPCQNAAVGSICCRHARLHAAALVVATSRLCAAPTQSAYARSCCHDASSGWSSLCIGHGLRANVRWVFWYDLACSRCCSFTHQSSDMDQAPMSGGLFYVTLHAVNVADLCTKNGLWANVKWVVWYNLACSRCCSFMHQENRDWA